MVTLAPGLRSPVTLVSLSREICHFSLSFWTVIEESVTSTTGPVTWYVLVAAAKAADASSVEPRASPESHLICEMFIDQLLFMGRDERSFTASDSAAYTSAGP